MLPGFQKPGSIFSFSSNLFTLIFKESADIIIPVNDEFAHEQTGGERIMKKLCKSNTNRKICGVCGGIAEYLNADPTIIRLAFLLIGALAGSGVVAYIVAALVMPEAQEVND